MRHALTYMSYMHYINTYSVYKDLLIYISVTPLLPLTSLSSWDSESLLEELNRVVNNVEISSRKPNLVLLRAFKNSLLRTT